ncbi:multidrug RND transporter [Glutamicibacter sp. BW78]|uniref:MMPL family transporter n=1 Tax=Glutamicibacter sp. BW78 TaxID=2024403 RepID=UPI000BB90FEA|nr:MMPL family transporter [Glutamicibacter sp. BW78]PCC26568.1 multidrug RND transporter [Glutamicibacter sp. BW78]
MKRLVDFVLSHSVVVVVVWLLVATAGGATAGRTIDALSYDFGLPAQPAYETNMEIRDAFGSGGVNDPLLLTAAAPEGQLSTAAGRKRFSEAAEKIAAGAPGTRVVTPVNSDPGPLISRDGTRAVALLYPRVDPGPEPYAAALPGIERAANEDSFDGQPWQLTSSVLLAENGGSDRGILVEIILGGAGALIVLALVFASLLAGLPLLVAAVSILATFLALLGLSTLTEVSFVVQYLVALIGLGVAIDYSLLIVMRWREERAKGADNDTAVRTAMATAGRSVVFSGVTVAVSLAALIAVPLPFLRSIGLGGLLIPLLSVATSLTLVPVILHTLGPRLLWPRRAAPDPTSRRWESLARKVVKRPWWVIAATTVLLVAMATPLFGLRLGSPTVDTFEDDGSPPGSAALVISAAGLTPSLFRPTQVIASTDTASTVTERLNQVAGVAAATRIDSSKWRTTGIELIEVFFDADPSTDAGSATLERVRAEAAHLDARVGGSPAEDADFVTAVYGNAPLVVALIVLVTFVLLARALRSVWLPVKALVLNVLSLGAAFGVTTLIWQHGIGTEALFGIGGTGALTIWIPAAGFAFLFGLSMDYEVFILSRMREAYDEHQNTPRAVVEGIARTGRLVTSAALILFLAFIALSTVPVVEVKILATTLAVGIAIDAVLVRSLLAPALVVVLGSANWDMPGPLARILWIVPSSSPRRRAKHLA